MPIRPPIQALKRALTLIGLVLALITGAVHAQPVTAPLFTRDRNISVSERVQPDYDPRAIQVGAVTLYPEIMAGLEHLDNVFASRSAHRHDQIGVFQAGFRAGTLWSRHSLDAEARLYRRAHRQFRDESSWNWQSRLQARLEINHASALTLKGQYFDLTEPRTAAGTLDQAAAPTRYNQAFTDIALHNESSRFKLAGTVTIGQSDYHDVSLIGGGTSDQDFRDHSTRTYSLRADYALSPEASLFVRAGLNRRAYQTPSAPGADSVHDPVRDSFGQSFEFGTDFDLAGLASGAIGLGLSRRDYDSPAYDTIDGLAVNARLGYFPTRLTTLSLVMARGVNDGALAGSPGYVSSYAGITIDHELRRNLVVSTTFSVGEDQYAGLERTDERFAVSARASYSLNPKLSVKAGWAHARQDSHGADSGQSYARNAVTVSLVFHL